MDNIKVLQCGFPKSGNSLLNRIIVRCLRELNSYKTFMQETGLARCFKQLYKKYDLKEFFEGHLEIDNLSIDEKGNFILRKTFPDKEIEKIYVNINLLLSTTSLVWSHLKVDVLYPFFLNFGIRFYIIRDGRDVVNSLIHFTTQENVRKFFPFYEVDEPQVLYSNYDLFSRYVKRWKEHIETYLKYREFFIEIRFEDLKNFGNDFQKILKLFNLKHKEKEFREEFSFQNMKSKSPLHLRKGIVGDWRNFFSDKHKEIFKEIAGETLIKLGYEKNLDW